MNRVFIRRFICFFLIVVSSLMFNLVNLEAGVSQNKVLADFKRTYKNPAKRKILKIVYLGQPRNFSRIEGIVNVYYQARRVAVYNLFTECGLKVKYIWEVWYRRSGNRLRFAQIAIWSHKFLNKPPKKLPGLDDNTIKALINKNLNERAGYQTYKAKAVEISVKKKKGKYNFCTPVYDVTSKVKINAGEENKNIVDVWSCNMASTMRKKSGTWEIVSNDCLYHGKKQACLYEKMCKKLGTKSKVPTITWGKAKPLIEKYLKNEARFKISKFLKLKFIRQEGTAKGGLRTWFVVHTVTDNFVPKNTDSNSVDYTYRYECTSYFELGFHSYGSKKWEIDNSECCGSGNQKCSSGYCSDYRKCKLIKKIPLQKVPSLVPENKTSDLVDCGNKYFQLKNSPASLIGWANSAHKSLMKNGKAASYCEKALKYEGSAYCQDKANPKIIKKLKETLNVCK